MSYVKIYLKNSRSIGCGLIIDLIDLFNELIKYKNIKLREIDSNDMRNQMKTIDQIIEQNLVKLPSLVDVEEKELLISNIETNLQIRKKQFYYVILYYMINKHWPYIKKASSISCLSSCIF